MKSCQILIVDDEPIIVKVLSFVFKKEGCTVETASDGEEGMRKIKELKPKIVLLDVMMPKKSGLDRCLELKSDPKFKDTYIIFSLQKARMMTLEPVTVKERMII